MKQFFVVVATVLVIFGFITSPVLAASKTAYFQVENKWDETVDIALYHQKGNANPESRIWTGVKPGEITKELLEVNYETGFPPTRDYWTVVFRTESGKEYQSNTNLI